MLAILGCILTGTVLGVIFTLFRKWEIDNFQAIVFNYFTCLIVGSLLHGSVPFNADVLHSPWFVYDILLGFLFIFGFNIAAITFQNFGVALTTVMQKMSLVLTVLVTVLIFHESTDVLKIVGVIIAVVAIFMVNKLDKGVEKRILQHKYLIIFPGLVLVLSSVIEIILFYVQHTKIVGSDQMPFTTHGFGMAAVYGGLILVIGYVKGRFKFAAKNVYAGILLGLPNYFSIFLVTVILSKGYEASVTFPLLNVSVLILSAIIGWRLFKEKLSPWNWLGIVFAVISIILIAMSSQS